MRTSVVVIVAVVLGLIGGIGGTWAKFDWSLPTAIGASGRALPPQTLPEGPLPKVVVDHEEFDFGSVERDSTVRHVFRFTNKGDAPLLLTPGGTTCMKCTISDLTKDRAEPGETVEVVVNYTASINASEFRQTAIINTNDPTRERVALSVFGKIVSSYRLMPQDIVFSNASVNENTTAEARLWGYLNEPLEILRHEVVEPETADKFDVQIRQMTPEELQKSDAKSGSVIAVIAKPGLPLGPIRQKIRLETNLRNAKELEIPVRGNVTSDISIMGSGWDAETGVLSIGPVQSSHGAKRTLLIIIRGPYRHDVKFQVAKNDAPEMKVSLGEATEITGTAGIKVPLSIEIPPGTGPVNHLGTDNGKFANIVLETTHPQAKQVPIAVRFAVER